MSLQGRKFLGVNGGYRYGFNGKENDKDAGEGIQDYGMRIYNERLGRFLSVAPITSKYPTLTPYQFASNSPISGVDLDGLEYLTAIYSLTIKNGKEHLTAKYIWYNAQQHNIHGPLGQGVRYETEIFNLDKNSFAAVGSPFTTAWFITSSVLSNKYFKK